jgi:predicted DNA-binding protein (MmcQ/YjbR family)
MGRAVVPKAVTPLSALEIDPLQGKRAQAVLARMRTICLALPETSEATQFGSPVFRAGKKSFATVHCNQRTVTLSFWVGEAGQTMVTLDPRFHVPAYTGHNGWIALDVTKRCDWDEVSELALTSYRHFALGRMLKALDAPPKPPARPARPAKKKKR